MPANIYMDWQLHYIELMPGLDNEITLWIENEGSLWIVVPADDEPISRKVYKAIESNYVIEYANAEYTLYHRAG